MADRIIDASLYLFARAWTVCATLLVIGAIGLASSILAPVSHPERVVVSLSPTGPASASAR
jgi:hypothetical protein